MNLSGSQASQPTELKSVKVQTSTYGAVIPLVYGTNRISGNLIWYGDFKAAGQSAGGK